MRVNADSSELFSADVAESDMVPIDVATPHRGASGTAPGSSAPPPGGIGT
jgi:hypothetical protein